MRCGISTSCFYPMPTLQAFTLLGQHGVKLAEVFLNSFGEMGKEHVGQLAKVQQEYGIEVCSLHPCSTILEGYLFASEYKGRVEDGIKLYTRYFEICNILGANKLVFHGDHSHNRQVFPAPAYAAHFCRLAEIALQYGVSLCQENVSYCRCNRPAHVVQLRPHLGKYAAFVLDTKQVRRKGESLYGMAQAMQGAISLMHFSDCTDTEICLPPGKGNMDILGFLENMAMENSCQECIIEVYSSSFSAPQELVTSLTYLEEIVKKLK